MGEEEQKGKKRIKQGDEREKWFVKDWDGARREPESTQRIERLGQVEREVPG